MNSLPLPMPATPAAPTSAPTDRATQRRWRLALGLYAVAANALFSNAMWLIYLAANGYSPLAIGLFEMGFHVVKFLAEVPTGVFADLVGRRVSLMIACALGFASALLFLAPTVPSIALAFALNGLAYAFRGGAEEAMVWTLAERSGAPDRVAQYSRLYSRMLVIGLVAVAVAEASGGFLAHVSIGLPFICRGVASALGLLPLLLLPEQRLAESHRARPLAHARAGVRAVRHDHILLGLLLLSGLTASIVTTVGFYTQLYFHSIGFSLAAIGLIFAASCAVDALATSAAPRLIARVRRRRLVPIFVACEALGLLAMSTQQPILGLIGFLGLFHVGDSVLFPAISTYLNERSPEAQRATVLSFDTGLFSAAMIVLFPLFGLGLTHVSYGTAYLWTLLALLAGCAAIAGGIARGIARGVPRSRQ